MTRGGGEEGLDAHLGEAGQRARGVVRVEVDSTKWPVSAACIDDLGRLDVADLADHDHVGVARRIVRSAAAKVRPAFAFTCTWLMPARRYSTGSSTVMILGLRPVDLVEPP